MKPYEPVGDAQKRFRGEMAGSRGGGFAEIIILRVKRRFRIVISKKTKKEIQKLINKVLAEKK